MNPKITADHLKRRAIVYIRQSSPIQVTHNLESQRRQYNLADQARQLGFQQVEIIDEDLGRSGSGQVERPGFERLVVEVCSGQVGAVFCIEASRLARNGRDWHHLIELCGLVRAIVIDPDGVYDPGVLNDRLEVPDTLPGSTIDHFRSRFRLSESVGARVYWIPQYVPNRVVTRQFPHYLTPRSFQDNRGETHLLSTKPIT